MMLADPGLVVTQPVQMFDQFQIAMDAQRGVFVDRMKRREEDSVTEFDGHAVFLEIDCNDDAGSLAYCRAIVIAISH